MLAEPVTLVAEAVPLLLPPSSVNVPLTVGEALKVPKLEMLMVVCGVRVRVRRGLGDPVELTEALPDLLGEAELLLLPAAVTDKGADAAGVAVRVITIVALPRGEKVPPTVDV